MQIATEYCRWLSKVTQEPYGLPTEAEWEYACREGNDTGYYFGSNRWALKNYSWFQVNSDHKTHSVGKKQANRWGLHDLHGNVWEWVQDWFGDYATEAQHNPTGPEDGAHRTYRGGGWFNRFESCRSTSRYRDGPNARHSDLGFRVVKRGSSAAKPASSPSTESIVELPDKPDWAEVIGKDEQ
ncbi:MAG: SUMF1/EgtB/PvdO family nonheme iron enzyme [Gammaproteobacteria bacterium]|nr:SUMF1/EgtB/PvdO family nonheme iron enzyme [Gammaproteobacteria bacterium]